MSKCCWWMLYNKRDENELVTKLLFDASARFMVSDFDCAMMFLARMNLRPLPVKLSFHDIRQPIMDPVDIIHSHGVLEHFNKNEICTIIKAQLKRTTYLAHYVPSNKYITKSFGDELLMSKEAWQYLVHPSKIVEFNEGKDLVLLWTR